MLGKIRDPFNISYSFSAHIAGNECAWNSKNYYPLLLYKN